MYVSCCRKRKKEEVRFSLGNINLGEDNLYLKYITVNSSSLSALFRLMNARNDSGEFKIFLNVEEKKNLFHASSATLWLRWLLLLSSVCAHWIQKKKCGAINYCNIQLTPSLSSLGFLLLMFHFSHKLGILVIFSHLHINIVWKSSTDTLLMGREWAAFSTALSRSLTCESIEDVGRARHDIRQDKISDKSAKVKRRNENGKLSTACFFIHILRRYQMRAYLDLTTLIGAVRLLACQRCLRSL